jgi:hypothetical protein
MRKKQLAIQNKRKNVLQASSAAPQDQSPSASNENTTAVAPVLPTPAPLMTRQSSGNIASGLQKTHPAMHPLPPKPGTAAPTPAKQPIAPPVTEKVEAQRTKKVAPPLAPRDPQLEGFEEVRFYYLLANLRELIVFIGEAEVILAGPPVSSRGLLAVICRCKRQPRKNDVDG